MMLVWRKNLGSRTILTSQPPVPPVGVVVSVSLSVDGPGDAELISAVRGGDSDAYGELFARHVDAARRLARQLTGPADADDLVSDAFTKVLTVLQRGGGPDLAFRAYLLTAVRRLHLDKIRAGAPPPWGQYPGGLAPARGRRPGGCRRGAAVPGHRGRGLRERRRREGLRVAPGALADGAVAHRGRAAEAGRHRAAARDERQLRLRPGLPRARGPPPGVLEPARDRPG